MTLWRPLERFVSSIKKRIAALTWTGGFRVISAEGLLFLLHHKNFVDRRIYLSGGWERDRIDYLLKHMAEMDCDVFFDIGANFGLYSLIIADRMNVPQILAFEPDPRNYNQFCANLYLNRLSSVISVRQCAISNVNDEVVLSLSDETSTGTSNIGDGSNGLPVDAIRLDDHYDFNGKTIAVKIDVEGHELHVVSGMSDILKQNRCLVQVESFSENRDELAALLGEYGYHLIHQLGYDHYFTNTDT